VISVTVAVGCLVAALTCLRLYDLATEAALSTKEAETQARTAQLEDDTRKRLAKLEDDYRKITLSLGFNLLILPREQSLSELHLAGQASKHLPEAYADRLAKSGIASINHLLPILQEKVHWPERERSIILVGTRGEVPMLHHMEKKPLLERVPPGTMVVGYELHRSLKLAVGEKVRLLGQEFIVRKLHAERGNGDDITVWINLAQAQKLLKRPAQITAILALECNCSADRLSVVRSEVGEVLTDTQVIELASQALARAEARTRAAAEAQAANNRATQEAREAVADERRARTEMRHRLDAFIAILTPLVVLVCVVWLGILILSNIRERAGEIGILRALGFRQQQISALLLARAAIVGFAGAALGFLCGAVAASFWLLAQPATVLDLVDPVLLLAVLWGTPGLCTLIAWVLALLADRQDPAIVLREV
jgi:hypothetical protein